jgi:catechol-2,3-dioxygenase
VDGLLSILAGRVDLVVALPSVGVSCHRDETVVHRRGNHPVQIHGKTSDIRTFSTLKRRTETPMELGAFSVSLAVKNIAASREFYEKLGFTVFGGNQAQRWLIMKNGTALIGLFEGMFEANILTFNPGWDGDAKKLPQFSDVRDIQRHLKSQGVDLTQAADERTTGPAHIMLVDPDGNQILIDQHV